MERFKSRFCVFRKEDNRVTGVASLFREPGPFGFGANATRVLKPASAASSRGRARNELSRIQFFNGFVRRHSFAISRPDTPELCHLLPALSNQRAQGMPGARCARSRAWCVVNTRVSHHGHTGNTRHSPRNGFNGLLRALPGDRACLPPSSAVARQLDTSVGASGPHDFAVRFSAIRQERIRVHRIPPRVRDDREPPLCGTGRAELVEMICPTGKAEYFCKGGWTGKSLICPSGNPICDIGRTAIAYRTFAASEVKLGGRTFRNLISALLINARWALSGNEARFVNVVALVDKPANRSNSWTKN